MKRSERRHHEERVKARWRKRMRRLSGIQGLNAWKAPPPEAWVEQNAVRKAHHPKCPCGLCKKPRYQRGKD